MIGGFSGLKGGIALLCVDAAGGIGRLKKMALGKYRRNRGAQDGPHAYASAQACTCGHRWPSARGQWRSAEQLRHGSTAFHTQTNRCRFAGHISSHGTICVASHQALVGIDEIGFIEVAFHDQVRLHAAVQHDMQVFANALGANLLRTLVVQRRVLQQVTPLRESLDPCGLALVTVTRN